jgi:hypothetical protein
LVNGVRAGQADGTTQQLQALRVSLAAAQSGWLGKLHSLLKSIAADPELKPYGSVATIAEVRTQQTGWAPSMLQADFVLFGLQGQPDLGGDLLCSTAVQGMPGRPVHTQRRCYLQVETECCNFPEILPVSDRGTVAPVCLKLTLIYT